jgi:hypothetical protein
MGHRDHSAGTHRESLASPNARGHFKSVNGGASEHPLIKIKTISKDGLLQSSKIPAGDFKSWILLQRELK